MASGGMPIPWDGKNELGQTIDGAFTWVVTANVTSTVAGPGGGLTARDQKSIQAKTKKPIVIEVFANMKGQRKRVALYKPGDSSMIDLQKHIFPYGRSGQDNTLEFEMTGPEPTQPFIAWVLELHSTVSDAVKRVTLAKAGGKFKGQLTIGPSLIKEGTSLTKDGQPVRTTATACLGYGNIRETGPFDFVNEILNNAISEKVYPAATQQLGILDDQTGRRAFISRALPTVNNIACFGFEALDISLLSQPNVNILLKVRHPANEVWLGVHGGADGSISSITEVNVSQPDGTVVATPVPGPNIVPGRDITSIDTQNIRTLVLSACEALDLHDYNNTSHSPDVGIEGRVSPGQLWWKATDRGRSKSGAHTVLLGFNRVTAGDPWLAYRQELTRLANLAGPSVNNLEALAWMNSNFQEAKSGRLRLAAGACAWSEDHYYYIPYELDNDPEVRWRIPGGQQMKVANTRTMRGIYRIHKRDWDTQPSSWIKIPAFAELVKVP